MVVNRSMLGLCAALALTGCAVPMQNIGDNSFLYAEQESIREAQLKADELGRHMQDGAKPEEVVAQAQEAVAYELKDPESARFRNVKINDYHGGKVVCGEVNAKNSYGGYVGFRRFYSSHKNAVIEHSDARRSTYGMASNAGLNAACAASYSDSDVRVTRACDAATIERLRQAGYTPTQVVETCGR